MKPATPVHLGLSLLLVLALAACTSGQLPLPPLRPEVTAAPAQATAAPVEPTAAPAQAADQPTPQPAGTLQAPIEEVCNGMAQALSEALSRAASQTAPFEVTQSQVPMTDYARGGTGTGCRAAATGTGAQFSGPDAVMKEITAVLTSGGWVEDPMLAAGGPTGIGSGFRSADLVSIASAGWQPDAATSCPSDKPISECQVPPEHQAYTITLDTAQTIGYGGAVIPSPETQPTPTPAPGSVGMPNPASQNCVAQGGSLTIEERPGGGEYGVCYFEDNKQCEEWALMRGECPVGGVKVTGYTTPAATYCAISGGTYSITSNSGEAKERGTCVLPDGRQCEAWSYYLGGCDSVVIGMANPAAKNCTAQGGQERTVARPDGGQYGVCLFEDNKQCEEWALLRGQCPVGGVAVAGYTTSAATYCAITGGKYTVTGREGQANEAGTCALPDGTTCEVWSYYQGGCQAASKTEKPLAIANPASQNCVAQGGDLKIEQRGDGGQYGVCYFEDNLQCEEWALMRGACPVGGVKVTGYATPAATFCAITGGTYAITANSGQADEQGNCTLPGGKVCDVWSYYNGKCDASSGV